MKYLLIFLTLPFFLTADQVETKKCFYKPIQDENRSFETSWEHSEKCPCAFDIDSYELEEINELKQELGAIFYSGKIHLNLECDGHLWTPVLFVHSIYCPCLKH